MNKIPLERTIGDTYRFAFSNILSIFGIVWLPLVLAIALCAAAVWSLLPDFAAIDLSSAPDVGHNQDAILHLWFKMAAIGFPLYVLFYIFFAMITVGIQRKALGLHPGPVFVYFSLGGEVWRLFGGVIFAMILLFLNVLCTEAVVFATFWIGEHYHLPSIYGLVETIAVIAGVCWFFYSVFRLLFFMAPALVAEGGFGLARSWELGRGNFWRIFVLLLACVVGPSFVISMVSEIVVMPFMGPALMKIQQAQLDHQVLTPQQMWAIIGPALHNFLPLWIGYEIVTLPILLGLQNAVSAFAYKNLTQSGATA
ncbi:MAG TPA: hypothetical protein VMF58_07970 [Rhizomicrobium sp.]|nr:hypothetical protein [Rhizomicrobium sp.]